MSCIVHKCWLMLKTMRQLDVFVGQIAKQRIANNNVELGGHNAFKFFPFGIAHIIRKIRRVDGSWHMAMAR